MVKIYSERNLFISCLLQHVPRAEKQKKIVGKVTVTEIKRTI
jgi:hypothetical protein